MSPQYDSNRFASQIFTLSKVHRRRRKKRKRPKEALSSPTKQRCGEEKISGGITIVIHFTDSIL